MGIPMNAMDVTWIPQVRIPMESMGIPIDSKGTPMDSMGIPMREVRFAICDPLTSMSAHKSAYVVVVVVVVVVVLPSHRSHQQPQTQ
jgi:hypothetical protein